MISLILFIIGCVVFFGYTIFIEHYIGIENLPSLSQSYYELEKKKKSYRYIFQAMMVIVTFLFAIVMLEITHGYWWQFVGLLAIAPIGFVGVAPRFKIGNMLEREVHFAAAKMAAGLSFVWVIFASAYIDWRVILTIPMTGIIAFILYAINGKHTKVYYAEMACFWWTISTIGILLYDYLVMKS